MPGGIDHLVLVSQDLDQLGGFYRSLGFQLGARNRHDWGTLNHIVQFDGCFLELLTTESQFTRAQEDDPVAQFANIIADYVDRHPGFATLVLESRDAAADQSIFAERGIAGRQTFYFERQGKRPDGSAVKVAFSLAFAELPQGGNGFFVCQQHAPEAFWNAAFQQHDNGVTGIAGVSYVADDPAPACDFFQGFADSKGEALGHGQFRVTTQRGWIDVLDSGAAATRYGTDALPKQSGLAAVHFRCSGIDKVAEMASSAGIATSTVGAALTVPAAAAHGVTLVFEQ